jgi:hypothetical protein
MLDQLGAKAPASGDISRVIAQLTVELEKIPIAAISDGILNLLQRSVVRRDRA